MGIPLSRESDIYYQLFFILLWPISLQNYILDGLIPLRVILFFVCTIDISQMGLMNCMAGIIVTERLLLRTCPAVDAEE